MRMLEARSKGKEIKFNKLLLAVPALCDAISSTLHYIALNFISGSIYLMLRGGTIVTTLMFSILFLKFKARRHHLVGSAMAIVGVLVVGMSNILFSDGASSDGTVVHVGLCRGNNLLGMGLLFSVSSLMGSSLSINKNSWVSIIFNHFKLLVMKEFLG